MYNLTEMLNTTDYGRYMTLLNQESGYVLGITLMVTIMIIIVIALYKEGMAIAATASGFITTLISIILFALEILAPHWIIVPVVLFAAGFIGLFITKE